MKAYKLRVTTNGMEKGRIIYEDLILATPTKPTRYNGGKYILSWNKENFEEVELENEKWIHPHLIKPLKNILFGRLK